MEEFEKLDSIEMYLVEKWRQESSKTEEEIAHAIRTMRKIFADAKA